MVDSVSVIVVAGMVYTPGVGQVVACGVGTTGAGELEGMTGASVEVVGTAAGAEVAGGGGK